MPDVISASVAGKNLPLPKPVPLKILILGDTGCRMKSSDNAFQSCDDMNKWAFSTVAKTAASFAPDLVVHVGDYHYRENPCPENNAGCAGSPWGYGWDAWQADFYAGCTLVSGSTVGNGGTSPDLNLPAKTTPFKKAKVAHFNSTNQSGFMTMERATEKSTDWMIKSWDKNGMLMTTCRVSRLKKECR
jgi:hypothetical protein